MAKREAEEQITKDGPAGSNGDGESRDVSWASTATLAKRKILKPRGKNFSLPQASNNSTSSVKFTASPIQDPRNDQLKALARNFAKAVQSANTENGVPDFRPIAEKYLQYYQKIETGFSNPSSTHQHSSEKSEPAFTQEAPTSTEKEVVDLSQSSSGDDSEEETSKSIEVKGPTFSIASIPTSKNSPFTFGPKPAKKEIDSDSDSEVEIKGPTFTFSKQISDPVFKLATTSKESSGSTSITAEAKTNSGAPSSAFNFNFGGTTNNAQGAKAGDKDSGFSFISAQNSEAAKAPSFNFSGSQKQSDERTETAEDKTVEEETGGEFAPVVSMDKEESSHVTGEESEDIKFQKKAKVLLYNAQKSESPYENMGVGELKVLTSATTNRSRIVVRADGGFRVLLNVSLNAALTYSTMGNGSMVRVPVVNPDKSLTTYVLKVKTTDDGKALCDLLNEAKTE